MVDVSSTGTAGEPLAVGVSDHAEGGGGVGFPAYNTFPPREALKMTTALSLPRQKSPLDELVPDGLGDLSDEQTAIPRIARDPALTATIAGAVERVPTAHRLLLGDSRDLSKLESGSVHLVLTSPPYWTLKPHRAGMEQNYTEPASDLSVAGFIDGLLHRCAPRADWEQRTLR